MAMDAEDRAGLYITVIFHLVVVIALLCFQLGAVIRGENTFILDFSKEEEIQKEKEEQEFKESVSQRLDELIASSAGTPVRNIAVDRGSTLKDDRNTDAEQLYKDAEKLAKDLKNGFKVDEPDEDYVPVSRNEKAEDKSSKQSYSGPSVVSYELDGRKASRLSIPAYRCLGAGHVTDSEFRPVPSACGTSMSGSAADCQPSYSKYGHHCRQCDQRQGTGRGLVRRPLPP